MNQTMGVATQETVMLPAIVDEQVRTDIVTEIQPIITRHIEQREVHHIEKHIYDTAPPCAATVTLPPIVREVVHPVVVTEVQEIVHREVPVLEVHQVSQFSEENVVLPTEHSSEVLSSEMVPPAFMQSGLQSGGPAPVLPRSSKLAAGLEAMAAKFDSQNNITKVPSVDPNSGLETIPRSNGLSAGLEKQAAKMDARKERHAAKRVGSGAS